MELLKNIFEERKQVVITIVTNSNTVSKYNRFLSLYKLLREIAYILRFISNIRCDKESRRINAISAGEIKIAKLTVVKYKLKSFQAK